MNKVVQKPDFEAIKQGLNRGEFIFHYQPQISLVSGQLIGAEALIRWVRPNGEMIPPNDFLPLAEKTGLITQITEMMIEQFAADARIVQDVNDQVVMAMNVSPLDLESNAFQKALYLAVDRHRLKKSSLAIEVTETAVMDYIDTQVYDFFLSLGIPLVMDDYGTGHANLASLINTPFTKIKLDKSLLKDVMHNRKHYVIVKDQVRMAHRLGMEVVAEGVEYQDVYEFLQGIGCSTVQGFLISKPMPLSRLMELIADPENRWNGTPAGLLHLAQLDHIEWRKEIIDRSFKFNPEQDDPSILFDDTVINPTQCMLGRWYYGPGKIFGDMEEYQAVAQPHNELHMLGHQLIAQASRYPRELNEMLDTVRALSMKSMEILNALQAMEDQLMADHFKHIDLKNIT